MGTVRKDAQQLHLLKQSLTELLNPNHPLCAISGQMGWREIEAGFEPLYAGKGRRPKPIRLMVSLLMLKRMYGLSDESVVRIWVENPYFQFFSGETVFQWKRPCHPTDLVISENGSERRDLVGSRPGWLRTRGLISNRSAPDAEEVSLHPVRRTP